MNNSNETAPKTFQLKPAQFALWTMELLGQLSDGGWKNTNPHDHWEFWHELENEVSEETKIINIDNMSWYEKPKKTSYGFAKVLIDAVGDRMINIGRMGKAVGQDIANIGKEGRSSIEDLPEDAITLKDFKAQQITQYDWRNNDYYWEGLTEEHLEAYYNTIYTEKELRADLREINKVMKDSFKHLV